MKNPVKKSKGYFQNIELKPNFKKFMEEVERRGYLFYKPAKKEKKDEGKK